MNRRVAIAAVFLACLGIVRGAAEKPPLQHEMMGVPNGCFVETVAFLDHWHDVHGADAWARMLQWGAKEEDELVAGHAVGVCDARGQIWSWDINFGWRHLAVDAAERENIAAVAKPILAKYPNVTARFPIYRFDFAQPASASPPVAQPAAESEAVRFASIVGERLSHHRPVAVVRFTRPGDAGEGAAVIFTFNGRYCIYVPELGTTPFVRVRGSVENLRLIQQALNRLVPGVTQVRRL